MDYVDAAQKGSSTVLYGVRYFQLAQTLDCGQAFRWHESRVGEFSGIAHGRRLNLFLNGDELTLEDVSLDEFEQIWKKYFGFDYDYHWLRAVLSKTQQGVLTPRQSFALQNFATPLEKGVTPPSQTNNLIGGVILKEALDFSPGLRLLRQDTWEILVSFILSQNSNIPRIKQMIERLCKSFGEKLPCGGYAFPAPKIIAELDESALAPIKCGYRAQYILDAARRVADGRFNMSYLEKLPSDEVFTELLKIHGVGPKVAECVLLYGFGRVERYPVDVWIKRVMAKYFPDNFPDEIKEFSGIAQQFLFHYIRTALHNR